MASMSIRTLLVAVVLAALAACGGETPREVKLLAPADLVEDAEIARFERDSGCRVDLRVYDDGEDLDTIADRRDTDVIAEPVMIGDRAHDSVELVRVKLRSGVVLTVPRELAGAFDAAEVEPAGRRNTAWTIRAEGDNPDCARSWLAYATSQ
jgi:predicted small lipoprotein YifL